MRRGLIALKNTGIMLWAAMSKSKVKLRIDMLKELISWREITDEDISNVGIMDFLTCLNDEEIFPRNAIKRLFNYYYKTKNTEEIGHFIKLVAAKFEKSSYYCSFYGKEFKKIITFLKRAGNLSEAKQSCERYLINLNVLQNKQGKLTILSFSSGNYSYSWPVIFTEIYLKILIQLGEIQNANKLVDECLNHSELMEDSKVIFCKIKQKLSKRRLKPLFPIINIKKDYLEHRHLAKQKTELIALSYLRNELDMEGIFAEVDIWRLFPDVISYRLSKTKFCNLYRQIIMLEPPEDIYDFILYNSNAFKIIFQAENVTFGMVGYPDLIMYKKNDYNDFFLAEVKDINDRLSPHQEAWINYFLKNRIPFKLFQFMK